MAKTPKPTPTPTPTNADVFTVSASPRSAMAPQRVTIYARYNVATTRGVLCIVIDGPLSMSSCWEANGQGTPQVVRVFDLPASGEYDVLFRSATNEATTTVRLY